MAVGVLVNHPDWTIPQIAEEIGVHRGTLYRCKVFISKYRPVRELARKEDHPGSAYLGVEKAWTCCSPGR
jgi:hypothetical protein